MATSERLEDHDQASTRVRVIARIAQVIDYSFSLIYGLLGVRFLLGLVAARPGAGFSRFIDAVTDPLYAPFRNIVESLQFGDGRVILSLAVAFVAYGVLHLAIRGILVMIASRTPAL